ncbi:starch synthase [Breznakia sp. PF5-3]|uniref:glycogen synthase GlgA n=1 Tax=unclassified Breznakia TaxID=2623764 RepID=UPI002404D696|nr:MULTISPECIES: glycogen synthase GlgA [unclassified Breznakia]MDF9824577.1 starch synthase [Breznakia sp. PM6-1]MDF9835467.1 starch synthase [Breznakia sp. PF5-3]MDF9837877.1 starch synthase [Breznakia sp. PFB2-8]MDF9859830.1 starch synthase [Breznakia sp. PH5-24]
MKSALYVAAEGLPYIKSGGLADVIGSLPKAIQSHGVEVRVVIPLYLKIAEKYHEELKFIKEYFVSINYQEVPVRLLQSEYEGVTYYFIEHQGYFEREAMYGYGDDGERFAYFQKAVLEMLNQLDYFPDILHCHDWHTGMIPVMCKENYQHDKRYRQMKHVYTIHNLAYQGNFSKDMLDSCLGLSMQLYDNGNVRFDTGISFMKSGIVYADQVTTVSPTYAQEILTSEYGEHLEHVLQMRAQNLTGIVNGIDTVMWDPKTDVNIDVNFNQVNVFKKKSENKTALQKELGLKVDPDVFLLGMVTRLTGQKGLNLVQEQMSWLIDSNIQMIILGSGDQYLEDEFNAVEAGNKGKFVFYCGYNETLAHKIYASCDGFLMPSKFEPCGISQLISLHYGTLPIVRETGGLKDTITPYNEFTGEGNGFSFANFNGWEMMECVKRALHVYYDNPAAYRKLIKNAMKGDVSWDKSAVEYIEMYKKVIK